MRPTGRGWVLIAGLALAIASATVYGPRGLNAIVAPGAVALVAAVWQMYRFEPPTVVRELPVRGERGSTVPVRLEFETATPRSARVTESVEDGLEAPGAEWALSLGTTTLEYDLHLRTRGKRRVGPTTVVVRDVLGLLERRHTYSRRDRILVHPRIHHLSGSRREALARLHGAVEDDRQAFDGLRRYQRGDPLRDVHWKSSAKQPDGELVVQQFATEEGSHTVVIAAELSPGSADAVVEATASVAVALLAAGVGVGVVTPTGRVAPDAPDGRVAILDHLAIAEAGTLPDTDREEAIVHVAAESGDGDVRVTVDGRTHEFAALAGTRLAAAEPPGEEVVT